MFDKYAGKLREEQQELMAEKEKTGQTVSNLEHCIDKTIALSSELATVWTLSDYKGKQGVQFLLFPDGIYLTGKQKSVEPL